MMDHEERTCPRCGEPAGDHRLWPSCGLNLAPVSENPGAADQHTAYARVEPREANRWGEPVTVEMNGFGEQPSRQPSNGQVSERPTTEMTVVRLEPVVEPADVEPERIAADPEDTVSGLEVIENQSDPELNEVDDSVEQPTALTFQREVDQSAAQDVAAKVDSAPPRRNPHASREYIVTPAIGRSSGSRRVAVVCLAALMGLVAALAGRRLRRCR